MPYIDIKYLFKCETCRHNRDKGCDVWCENGECYSPALSKMPLANVEEVKQGYWIDNIEFYVSSSGIVKSRLFGYICSVCGRFERKKEPYCNCGAKMTEMGIE